MAREDDRHDDRGRNGRRPDLKMWLQVFAIALTLAAVLLRTGQLIEGVEGLKKDVTTLTTQIQAEQIGQATLKVRVDAHDKEITNHEIRITRIERRER